MLNSSSNIRDYIIKDPEFPDSLISRDIPKSHIDSIFDMSSSLNKDKSLNESRNSNLRESFIITKANAYDEGGRRNPNLNANYNNNPNFNQYQNTTNANANANINYADKNKGNTEWKKKKDYSNYNNNNNNKTYKQTNSIARPQKENVIEYFNKMEMTMTIEEQFSLNENKNLRDTMEAEPKPDYKQDSSLMVFTDELREKLNSIPTSTIDKHTFPFTNKNSSFTPVNIKLLYKINDRLKYPKEDPLWYIYHAESKSSFGPLSSMHLEELYNQKKNVDGVSDVRFIDIFKLKNKGPFAFFKLKDIENESFLRDFVDPTSLLKYVDELNRVKKEESGRGKIGVATVNALDLEEYTKDTLDKYKKKEKIFYFDEMFDDYKKVKVEVKNNNNTSTNTFNNNLNNGNNLNNVNNVKNVNKGKNVKKPIKQLPPPMIVNIKNNVASVIDEAFNEKLNEEKDKEVNQQNINNINNNNFVESTTATITTPSTSKGGKGKKKQKGKPVDLDIKTGFYTLSHQEKNYEPIFICGDIDAVSGNK